MTVKNSRQDRMNYTISGTSEGDEKVDAAAMLRGGPGGMK
jgi:hypothetical protein